MSRHEGLKVTLIVVAGGIGSKGNGLPTTTTPSFHPPAEAGKAATQKRVALDENGARLPHRAGLRFFPFFTRGGGATGFFTISR
jgi:hypothetical protein